ncbi:MAG: isoprenylcysteine carboxylmethyltransferase family protein [Pseudobacteriovorax sp.]|nr:isoprenylcysteine carboxylmethyltransferase family protein [Pseudobacteriovorax sp.]
MKLFRPSRETSDSQNILKTLLYSLIIWIIGLILIPWFFIFLDKTLGLHHFSNPFTTIMGWMVLLLASIANLYTGFILARNGKGTPLPLDTAQRLVIVGPYRFVRNPMAMFGLTQGIGVSLIVGSWSYLLAIPLAAGIWHFLVRPLEERDMMVRFGNDYQIYCQAVRCWIPRCRPW